MSIEQEIDGIAHLKFDLMAEADDGRDLDPHQPTITVWAGMADNQAHVTLCLAALWGQPMRFADLTPDQAITLADALTKTASAVNAVLARHKDGNQ
jgi:hypothetical protein